MGTLARVGRTATPPRVSRGLRIAREVSAWPTLAEPIRPPSWHLSKQPLRVEQVPRRPFTCRFAFPRHGTRRIMQGEGHPRAGSDFPKRKASKALPKTTMLPGTVCVQWVRCGRKNCHCARGKRHGPYHYRLWREGGQRRKVYVKSAELEQVQAQCQARKRNRQALADWHEVWREMVARVREVEQQCRQNP